MEHIILHVILSGTWQLLTRFGRMQDLSLWEKRQLPSANS